VVRLTTHVFTFICGRDAARAASATPMTANDMAAATQLLAFHQGRNDHVSDTGLTASQVDAQKQKTNTAADAAIPPSNPATAAFFSLGFIAQANCDSAF
jgi:hypothetical protein